MKPLERLFHLAQEKPRHIVLAEGEDPRIQEAAIRASEDGLSRITLLGRKDRISKDLMVFGDKAKAVAIIEPETSSQLAHYVDLFHKKRAHKGVDADKALAAMKEPLNYAAMMVHIGDADGTIAGAVATTADTIRSALQIIGKAKDSKIVSSFFLMLACAPHHKGKGGMIFSDCGLVVEPDCEELQSIALSSAQSCKALLGQDPQIAMLSFSTSGSATHPRVAVVQEAAKQLQDDHPELVVGGELQFDAAFEKSIRASKAPDSPLEDRPNVFIFPNLDAGNIGYKIAQRIGGMTAIGPVLQGLAKPANDLSRGCSVDDVLALIAVTTVQIHQSTASE